MEKKRFTLKKVPLEKLIRTLNDIYMSGADYVDLHGINNDEDAQDEITLTVPMDYMSDETKAQMDKFEVDEIEPGGLGGGLQPLPLPTEEPKQRPPLTKEQIIQLLRNG